MNVHVAIFLLFLTSYSQSLQSKALTTSFIPRTCQEGFESGHPDMQGTGMYWIDPDGHGIGEVPIYVLCEKGVADGNGVVQHNTVLMHDKEQTFGIQVCNDQNCVQTNEVAFNYTNASERQMWALAELSGSCRQSIEIKLVRDILKDNVWWEDRFFKQHVFWDGEQEIVNDVERHICACGREGTCLDPKETCNCDAAVAIPISDKGLLTDKDLLPVTKLHLGKIEYEGGEVTLGRFVCSGQQDLANGDGLPRSCEDLWLLGYTLNGVYTLKNPEPPAEKDCNPEKYLLAVYCDFMNPTENQLVNEKPVGTLCAQ